jgi:hypothetical protein
MGRASLASRERERLDFESAQRTNTVDALAGFLRDHPNGDFADRAKTQIETLQFQQAQATASEPDLERFAQHPGGVYAEQARKQIEKIHFASATKTGTEDAFELFLQRHPSGQYTANAKTALVELQFASASRTNTAQAYREFIKRNPESLRTGDATAALEKAMVKEILRKHPEAEKGGPIPERFVGTWVERTAEKPTEFLIVKPNVVFAWSGTDADTSVTTIQASAIAVAGDRLRCVAKFVYAQDAYGSREYSVPLVTTLTLEGGTLRLLDEPKEVKAPPSGMVTWQNVMVSRETKGRSIKTTVAVGTRDRVYGRADPPARP